MQTIKVGDTVTWTNRHPVAPYTIMFNLEFSDPFQTLFPVGLDVVGPLGHATISRRTQQVNSRFLWAAPYRACRAPDLELERFFFGRIGHNHRITILGWIQFGSLPVPSGSCPSYLANYRKPNRLHRRQQAQLA
jgi:hypothetical protein